MIQRPKYIWTVYWVASVMEHTKKATFLVVDNPQDSQEFISYKDPTNFYQSKSESDQCIEAEVKSEVLYYPKE